MQMSLCCKLVCDGENMKDKTIQDIEKRTLRYWFQDGLWDLGFGLVILLMGLIFLLLIWLTDETAAMILSVVQMIFVVGAFWVIGRVVTYLKERITYPRTGYVEYRRPVGARRFQKVVTALLLSMVISVFIILLATLPAMQNKMPAVIGAILAAVSIYLGWRFGVTRYFGNGVVTIIWGVVVSLWTNPFISATGIFFTGFGLVWLATGGIALWNYLRKSRPVGEDEPSDRQEGVE